MSAGADEQREHPTPQQETSFGEISEFIRTVAEHMRVLGLSSVDVRHHGTRIRLRSSGGETARIDFVPRPSGPVNSIDEMPGNDDETFITAPMIGTYYAAPGPGEPDFVEPGDDIEIGQTVGIIEAMKIMNEISADRAGIVLQILVRNAQAVEYGQPLLRIAPRDGE